MSLLTRGLSLVRPAFSARLARTVAPTRTITSSVALPADKGLSVQMVGLQLSFDSSLIRSSPHVALAGIQTDVDLFWLWSRKQTR
jgi:hypothetical protein